MPLTQHRPHGAIAGRRFGAFAGKPPGPTSSHPVGKIIQHRPIGAFSGKRYGSFAGKASGGVSLWDFAAPNELAIIGVVSVTGDIQFVVPVTFNLAASSAIGVSGTLAALGDIAYAITFNLAQTTGIGMSGTLGSTGDIGFVQAFDLSATGPITVIAGTIGVSGDFAFSSVPPDLSTPLRTFTLALNSRGMVMPLIYRDGVLHSVDTPRGQQRLKLLSGPFVGQAINEFGEVFTLL